MIGKEKQDALILKMNELGLKEEDFIEKFILGSGKGGQKINKTSSCVYLKHIPSGIEVKCQKDRSREANRFFARRQLCEMYDAEYNHVKTEKQKQIEKMQKQKKRRERRERRADPR